MFFKRIFQNHVLPLANCETVCYKDKLDSRVLPTINLVLALYQTLAVDDGGAEELLPEFIEKFKEARCPDWLESYSEKINLSKFFIAFWDSIRVEIRTNFQSLNATKNPKEKESKASQLIEKYGVEIVDCFHAVLLRKGIKTFLSFYVLTRLILCPALFGENLAVLLMKAKNGDRDSILKLIQVDKSLLEASWSMREIRLAQLSGDHKYFKALAKVLKRETYATKKRNYNLSLILVFFWEPGLNKLSTDEICDLVTDLGIFNGSSDTLYKEIKRLNLRKGG